jgi:hypothetical protein
MVSGVKESLFVGLQITSSLKANLDRCNPALTFYFKDNDPRYLQTTTIDGSQYLGKSLTQGMSISELEDVGRSIRSMVLKVAPEYRIGEGSIRVFAQTFIGV